MMLVQYLLGRFQIGAAADRFRQALILDLGDVETAAFHAANRVEVPTVSLISLGKVCMS